MTIRLYNLEMIDSEIYFETKDFKFVFVTYLFDESIQHTTSAQIIFTELLDTALYHNLN